MYILYVYKNQQINKQIHLSCFYISIFTRVDDEVNKQVRYKI